MAAYAKHVLFCSTGSISAMPLLSAFLRGPATLLAIRKGITPFVSCATGRLVCTEERIKIDLFRGWKQSRQLQFAPMREQMIEAMVKKVEDADSRLFVDDVNNLLPLVGLEQLDLLEKAIKKLYSGASGGQPLTSFNLGPGVVMTYYLLDQPDRMLAFLKDKELSGFISEISAWTVAFQLLYNKGRYQDVLDLYDYKSSDELESHAVKGFPVMWTTIVLTSCYNINTRESYDYALKLFSKMTQADARFVINPRQRALVSLQALKQNEVEVAYELCGPLANRGRSLLRMGISLRSLQVMCLARMGKVREALDTLAQYQQRAMGAFRQPGPGQFRQPMGQYQQAPGQFQQQPSGSFQQGQFQQMPGQFQQSPGQFQQSPGQFQQSPGQFQQPPGQFQQSPGQFQQPPGQFQQSPGQFQQSPGQFQRPVGQFQQPPPSGQFQQSARFGQSPPQNEGQFRGNTGVFQRTPLRVENYSDFNRPRFGAPQPASSSTKDGTESG